MQAVSVHTQMNLPESQEHDAAVVRYLLDLQGEWWTQFGESTQTEPTMIGWEI